MRKKEEKRLKNKQLQYDNGFSLVDNFFNYILTFADEYKEAADRTVFLLGDFHKNITGDRANFVADFKWLKNNVTHVSAELILDNINEAKSITKDIGIQEDELEELKNTISSILDKIQGWSIASSSITGI